MPRMPTLTTQQEGIDDMKRARFLSTGDMASYCEVTSAAVLNWIDSGKLPVYTTPGGHYRVLRTDFRAFLHRHGMFIEDGFFARGVEKKRILIVDDEAAVVAFIEAVLRLQSEYEVATAFDGFEAGRKLATFRPDLVILDIVLPGVDGFEICRRVKTDPTTQHMKVLGITGFATQENIERMLRYGADDYLEKPLKLQDLRNRVQQLLAQQT